MFHILLYTSVFLQHAVFNIAEPCTLVDPATTIEYVHSCPGSSTEWLKAAERKNCSAYEKTCGDNAPVKYHCVMNAYRNAMLEICAAEMSIVGHYCPEYNAHGNLIQEHYGTICKSCPFYYLSTKVYKYPDCFQYQNTKENSTPLKTDNNHTTSVGSTRMQNAFKNTASPMHIIALRTTIMSTNTATNTRQTQTSSNRSAIAIGITLILLIITALVVSIYIYKVTKLCKKSMYSELKLFMIS